ncbi:MAG: M23 family metallopeptidase [Nanoarchaeota archaeon]|nr:M23 family metallopeptidase [Nanoarchaeota archaeon]
MKKWNYETKTKNIYRLPHHLGPKILPEEAPSHRGRFHNSIDFKLPFGTPVYAALEGIVTEVVDQCEDDGRLERTFLPKSNSVQIRHLHHEFSYYVHLQKESIRVEEGQEVNKNQFLGLVGLSGYTGYSHLHFEVYQENKQFHDPTLLVQFRYRGKLFILRSPNK